MVKRDMEVTSRVAGNLATQAAERIIKAGGERLELTLPAGGTYIAKTLRSAGGTRVCELRRDRVLIDSRVLGNASRRVFMARSAFLNEFEELMTRMGDLIKQAHERQRIELIGRHMRARAHGPEAVDRALDAARRHGIDAPD